MLCTALASSEPGCTFLISPRAGGWTGKQHLQMHAVLSTLALQFPHLILYLVLQQHHLCLNEWSWFSQTKCSDVVGQSLVAAPSDVSGRRCSVLLDEAPPCRPRSQWNGAAFTEGLGFWGRDVNSLHSARCLANQALGRRICLFISLFFAFMIQCGS